MEYPEDCGREQFPPVTEAETDIHIGCSNEAAEAVVDPGNSQSNVQPPGAANHTPYQPTDAEIELAHDMTVDLQQQWINSLFRDDYNRLLRIARHFLRSPNSPLPQLGSPEDYLQLTYIALYQTYVVRRRLILQNQNAAENKHPLLVLAASVMHNTIANTARTKENSLRGTLQSLNGASTGPNSASTKWEKDLPTVDTIAALEQKMEAHERLASLMNAANLSEEERYVLWQYHASGGDTEVRRQLIEELQTTRGALAVKIARIISKLRRAADNLAAGIPPAPPKSRRKTKSAKAENDTSQTKTAAGDKQKPPKPGQT